MTKLLSVCIPTYNGGEYLKYNVNKLIDMSLKYNFDICVSDNASTDGTQEFMLKLVSKYDFVKYHRNNENMGFANNTDYVLKMADTEYVWLLGDDDEIFKDTIEKVIIVLSKYKPDICLLNSLNDFKIESKLYTDKNEVMSYLGLLLTCISNYVLLKTLVEKIELKKIKNNAFPHTIEILRFLNLNCKVYCLNNIQIKALNSEIRYKNKVIRYFFKDYHDIIDNINGYNDKAKKLFIKKGYELFNIRFIIDLRIKNAINFKCLYDFRHYMYLIPFKLKIIFIIFSCIPKGFLNFTVDVYKRVKRNVKHIVNVVCC